MQIILSMEGCLLNNELITSKLELLNGNKYREKIGWFYDDFEIGIVIESAHGRTITETDNIWQSLINNNPHPLHFDSVYGETTQFGNNLVSSLVTLSIVTGLSIRHTSYNAIANLGWEEIKLVKPVFAGDTLHSITEILGKRLSNSDPTRGIITVETKGVNQNGEIVMEFIRKFLVPREKNENTKP